MAKEWAEDEIKDLYFEDIQSKKQAGRGAISYTTKSYRHRLRSAADLMSPYERAKHRKAGEVMISNLFDQIITRYEFEKLDTPTQKSMLTYWREKYSNDDIMKLSGWNNASIAKFVKELELPPKVRKGTPRAYKKRDKKEAPAQVQTPTSINQENENIVQQQPVMKLVTKGLHLEYNGDYDAEQLSKIFTKLQLITDGETGKYQLNISLSERAK